MKFFSQLMVNVRAWQLLTIIALGLEFAALYFQYVLGLQPCIMCIYQRVAIWAIVIAGIIGIVGHNNFIARLLALAFWGTGAIWGLLIALEHVEIQSATLSFLYSCDIVPNFPSWAPLHEWIPFLFEASGDCGDINWQFMGYTMPQSMVVVYGVFTAAFALVLLSRLIDKRAL